jgi:predicted XRE-type DNA-binding protein
MENSYHNVWEALACSGEEAQNLTLRSDLMSSIEEVVMSWSVTQAESAKKLGISRPRMSDLMRGKMSKFSLDSLTNLAARAGLVVELTVKRAA